MMLNYHLNSVESELLALLMVTLYAYQNLCLTRQL